ncbi:MAG: MgtC/SapB family protein [Candidatus Eisenbacteria bacterium]|nr:MgtC/SapB family protein [Candidatus Eisenbacteria bacterium]
MSWSETLIRVGLALVLALPIGWEREFTRKPAGLRTHLLVSLGCCLFTLIGIDLAMRFPGGASDPARIGAQVVTGIGFLGGGAILRWGGAVHGLTTAASIWTTAAIGMAVGSGYYRGAAVAAVAAYIVLVVVERWERRFAGTKRRLELRVRVADRETAERVREMLGSMRVRTSEVAIEEIGSGETYLVARGALGSRVVRAIFHRLSGDPGVLGIERRDG